MSFFRAGSNLINVKNIKNWISTHLFLTCEVSWKIWGMCCSHWNLSWVGHKYPTVFFLSWQNASPSSLCNKVWKMAFYAITWSLWLFRNDMIFKGIFLDVIWLSSIILLRLAIWSKACWPLSASLVDDFMKFPSLVRIKPAPIKIRPLVLWLAPSLGSLKFNVDGSSLGKPGPAGIGGILRDDKGEIKLTGLWWKVIA
ncbi:hypothetical protein REPUB_Repub14bG0050700 [Reevesia pubescens]